MSEIKNEYVVRLKDGTERDIEAGGIEVGNSGELNVMYVYWTVMHTASYVKESFAPGSWASWAFKATNIKE